MGLAATVERHRAFFNAGTTRPLEFRRAQLEALRAALAKHEGALLAALYSDLRKSAYQGYATEIALVRAELRVALRNLKRWTASSRRRVPLLFWPARGSVQAEPLGVALIFAPWNYPAQLLLTPLISAIAAGNCVVLKPSELAPHTADAIAEMIRDTFAPEFVSVALGGAEVATALLHERFDKIFFTGSARVGRAVMAAAARNLTPVTLELGGKCPAIVCGDADIEVAARRIAWGKFLNAGQTCVAPDFVLVQREVSARFLAALKAARRNFYDEDASQSQDYGRIVNETHFRRLTSYLADGKIADGGASDQAALYLEPTILTDVAPEAAVMHEEIFGPILPVIEFNKIDEAIALLRGHPSPLALYLFTRDRRNESRLLRDVPSGGVCINDVIAHMVGTDLPFGGVGESGMGSYHGRAGFRAFSHERATLRRANWPDFGLLYPPQRLSLARLKRVLRIFLRG
ncbi:MAG: aldehyde dehydrogenase [Verrucomicrobiota bacterium]|nr:aldehyde dehydrogenase [Verrucomicrobiota bacterium]